MKVNRYQLGRYLLGLVMVVFALVQLNDPDPWRWIVAYGWTACGCIVHFEPLKRWRVLFGVLYILLGIWLFPSQFEGIGTMVATVPAIEQARESLGMIIAGGIWCLVDWLENQENKGCEQ